MLERLVRLYPAAWRARYGDELEELVRDLRPEASRVYLAADLVRGAIAARVGEVLEMQRADRQAMKSGLLIAGIVWAGLSAEILLTNVVFPSKTDDDGPAVLMSYLGIFAALFLVGRIAARRGAGRQGQVLAGLVAGAVIGAASVATFVVVDNVWLDIVARQPAKIDGFAHSGASSMRAYVNQSLIGAGLFLAAMFGALGALLSTAGGLSARRGYTP
ncbi:hypothetical protein [Dactylosporangium sp. NPDC048998]|uniref:hypothetical protein n=1 Tax=Dactylosporangium sp. NPDC048998 TaxID=3363976 RepID=UPI003710BCCC